jgi:hypothetical protein
LCKQGVVLFSGSSFNVVVLVCLSNVFGVDVGLYLNAAVIVRLSKILCSFVLLFKLVVLGCLG